MSRSYALAVWIGALLLVAPITNLRADETLVERRERVETMSPEEKEALRQKQERFVALPTAEQERIRKLHDQLASTSDADKLQGVLERYHGWLATLSSAQRAELLDLPADKRVAKIKELMRQQEEERFRQLVETKTAKLTAEDRAAIEKWLGDFAIAHKEAILEAIPREYRPRQDGDEFRVRGSLISALVWRWGNEADKVPRPTSEDIEVLKASLSEDARKTLEAAKDPASRQRLAQEWVRATIMSRRWRPEPVSAEELRKFYAEKLSAKDREKLETLPPEEMQQALRRKYHEHNFRERGGPPWGRGGDGGPGPGGRGGNEGPRRGDRNDKKGPPPGPRPEDGPPGNPPPPPDDKQD